MASLDAIINAVAAERTVEDSVVALLSQLSSDLQNAINANDPVQIQAIADNITANTDRLSQAVAANTPGNTTTGNTVGDGTSTGLPPDGSPINPGNTPQA